MEIMIQFLLNPFDEREAVVALSSERCTIIVVMIICYDICTEVMNTS